MPAGEGKFCWGFCFFSSADILALYRVHLFYSWQGCVHTRQCPDKWGQPGTGAVLEPSGAPALLYLRRLGERSSHGAFLQPPSKCGLCGCSRAAKCRALKKKKNLILRYDVQGAHRVFQAPGRC